MSHKTDYLNTRTLARGVTGIDDGFLYDAFKRIASLGPPSIACLHAENPEVIKRLEEKMRKIERTNVSVWNDTRPNFTEEESISRAIIIGKTAGCPIYIAHTTSAEGARLVAKAKSEGLNVLAETCPIYLTFTKKDYEQLGVIGKASPPLRDAESVERLWYGIENGSIDVVSSDHVVKSLDMKVGNGDIWSATPGFPGSATMLPVLLSEGVNKRKIPLEKIVEVSSYNAAKIFGLYPEKGTIAIGSDADFTIVDLKKKVVVNAEILNSSADWTIYDGWEFKGWPIVTIVRGNIVVEDGEIVGKPGTGKYIYRKLASVS
jgi:dihydropyrimidinase